MTTTETEPDAFAEGGGGGGGDGGGATMAEAVAEPGPEQARPSMSDISLDAEKAEPVAIDVVSAEPDPPVKETAPAPAPESSNWFARIDRKKLPWLLASLGIVIIIVVIVLIAVLTRKDSQPEVEEEPPAAVDFTTGVSLITSYAVSTSIRSRLARTKVAMKVANALDCSSIHAISLQLPLDARITSLKTVTDDGCTSEGDVQELKEARETFIETASGGLPGAYVEARDSFTHSVQVAIPPLGTSNVELIVEQLLKQRLDEVQFEMPVVPNEDIDSLVFDLMVEDTDGEPVEFSVDLDVPGVYEAASEVSEDGNTGEAEPRRLSLSSSSTAPSLMPSFTSLSVPELADLAPKVAEDGNATNTNEAEPVIEPIHLDVPDARQHDLPKVIRGRYRPGQLPDSGLLYTDGKCFEHYFHPTSLDPMPRNFLFLIDTSDSMRHEKLRNAQDALSMFIDSLTEKDHFAIQSFGVKGTEKLWGFLPATEDEKEEAKQFVDELYAVSSRTNLHEAFLEGLLRAKRRAEVSADNVATILVMLSDGWASRGETNRTKIAEHIYELNEEGTVKIFSLGFQDSADMQLLDAIALMNGGVSAPIIRGKDGFSRQITDFLDSEIGSILMSDVKLQYSTGQNKAKKVYGETQTLFPVMADGYEVVVRGLIKESDADASLNAVTSASTMDGIKKWEISALPDSDSATKSSLCFQSYAHDRITQLLRLNDASDFLGNDLIKRLVTLSSPCKEEDFAKCIKAEALKLAVDANIVAKGLTAMVTVDNEQCMEYVEGAEICLDGTTPDGMPPRDDHYYNWEEEDVGAAEPSAYAPSDGYGNEYYEERPDRPFFARSGAGTLNDGWFTFLAVISLWLSVTLFKI